MSTCNHVDRNQYDKSCLKKLHLYSAYPVKYPQNPLLNLLNLRICRIALRSNPSFIRQKYLAQFVFKMHQAMGKILRYPKL